MIEEINLIAKYLIAHWSHITAGLLSVATIVIHRGGIRPIGVSLWDSRPKPPVANNATPQSLDKPENQNQIKSP